MGFDSWWSLGESFGQRGSSLEMYRITCPFCFETGNFSVAYHAVKRKAGSPTKALNFDTLKCENCAGYVMILWSAGEFSGFSGLYDFRVLPWPLKLEKYPERWPEPVGRCWLQAHRSLSGNNWDAAAVMARSSLQAALRDQKATGRDLKAEINDLGAKRLLPQVIIDWSHEVRELGNDSAHPKADQQPTSAQDATDIVEFLDHFLEYLYDLPHKIEVYRSRRKPPESSGAAESSVPPKT